MAIFQNININFKLDKLRILEYSDRFGGMVEPYVISLFFKIDGERYSAFLRISNTQDPQPGTTQVVETSLLQLQLLADPDQQPLIRFPIGPILRNINIVPVPQPDSSLFYVMDISHIEFPTTLQPIPLVIDVLGLFDLGDILNGLAGLPILQELLDDENIGILNLAFENASGFLSGILGLNEELDSCPEIDLDNEAFMNNIEAQFHCLLPGTVGGVFLLMENDDFDENDIATIRDTLRDEIKETINNITNSVTRVNPIPETDNLAVDEGALFIEIFLDLVLRWDPVFLSYITSIFILSLLTGGATSVFASGFDDYIGYMLQQYDHRNIGTVGVQFSDVMQGGSNLWEGVNRWELTGKVEVL